MIIQLSRNRFSAPPLSSSTEHLLGSKVALNEELLAISLFVYHQGNGEIRIKCQFDEVTERTQSEDDNQAAGQILQQDRISRQLVSELLLPSGIFGLTKEPGTINQTNTLFILSFQPAGMFQFRKGVFGGGS